jgi:hypothetical protein
MQLPSTIPFSLELAATCKDDDVPIQDTRDQQRREVNHLQNWNKKWD